MFEINVDDGLSSSAVKVHPYSIYEYDDVWRFTRQVLIVGAVVAVLLSILYEAVKRYCFGVISGLGTVLITRTVSSAMLLLVFATISIMYRCFQKGYASLALFVTDFWGVLLVATYLFMGIAFVYRHFVKKRVTASFVEDGSWRYSQLYFSQYKHAYDEFQTVTDRGGLPDKVHAKYNAAGPIDKIVQDRFVQKWIFAATPNPNNPTAPLSNGTLSTSLLPKVSLRGYAPILVRLRVLYDHTKRSYPTLNCLCFAFAQFFIYAAVLQPYVEADQDSAMQSSERVEMLAAGEDEEEKRKRKEGLYKLRTTIETTVAKVWDSVKKKSNETALRSTWLANSRSPPEPQTWFEANTTWLEANTAPLEAFAALVGSDEERSAETKDIGKKNERKKKKMDITSLLYRVLVDEYEIESVDMVDQTQWKLMEGNPAIPDAKNNKEPITEFLESDKIGKQFNGQLWVKFFLDELKDRIEKDKWKAGVKAQQDKDDLADAARKKAKKESDLVFFLQHVLEDAVGNLDAGRLRAELSTHGINSVRELITCFDGNLDSEIESDLLMNVLTAVTPPCVPLNFKAQVLKERDEASLRILDSANETVKASEQEFADEKIRLREDGKRRQDEKFWHSEFYNAERFKLRKESRRKGYDALSRALRRVRIPYEATVGERNVQLDRELTVSKAKQAIEQVNLYASYCEQIQ